MDPILKQISNIGIVPVIALDDVDKAVPLAHALIAGGIPCAEVTFRTKEGEESIRRMAEQVPEILVGAGTVLTTDQVDRAIAAGAKFIVSPGLNPKVVAYCNEKNIPITPGCANPSDIEQAIELGLKVVKFFPAEQAGGLSYIKSISAPYSTMMFMPTGGINQKNMLDYLAFDKILACGGSWMVSKQLLAEGKFDEITRLCKEAVSAMLGYRLLSIGVSGAERQEAERGTRFIQSVFGFTEKQGCIPCPVEFVESAPKGSKGYIVLGTLQLERAMAHLKNLDVGFIEDSMTKNEHGKLTSVFLSEEMVSFGVKLIQL